MKITIKPVIVLLLVALPLLWALLMSGQSDLYHFSQGFFYLSIPLIMIITGYQLSKIFSLHQFFISIVIIGIITAILFIILTVISAGFAAFLSPYTEARFVVASGSSVCILSLITAAYSEYFGIKIFKKKKGKYLAVIINLIAIYLFASRTYWVFLFVFVILFSLKTLRRNKLLFAGFMLIAVLLISLSVIGSKEGLTFQNSILYKLINSFKEVKVRDITDYEYINLYFRGYEAYRSWVTFSESSLLHKVLGGGYGKLVTLDAEVLLDGKYWNAVPWVHNGFFFILVKEGLLGIVFALLFFFYLSRESIKGYRKDTCQRQYARLVLLGCTITLFVANYVVCGLFSHEMAILLISIGFLLSGLKQNGTEHEITSYKN
ncbi:MAG TPA: hypothetical protein PLZ75_11205 [Bacteroidales bacterium]|jgi:hypothetical protein|nr:hypothetical protein [Bacteroidales bacterium]HQH23414.1 hypothetical protein [Bacteroidales bacterium]HQJ81341.1 hypothetical protein [Bacteroidales bacterium]